MGERITGWVSRSRWETWLLNEDIYRKSGVGLDSDLRVRSGVYS